MERVAIIGASMTQFGQRDAWVRELLAEAGAAALDDAGIDGDDLDHLYVSNMASGEFRRPDRRPQCARPRSGRHPAYPPGSTRHPPRRCGRVRRVAVDRLWHERSDDARRRREDDPPDDRGGDRRDRVAHPPGRVQTGRHAPLLRGAHGATLPRRVRRPRESLGKVAVKNHKNGVDNPTPVSEGGRPRHGPRLADRRRPPPAVRLLSDHGRLRRARVLPRIRRRGVRSRRRVRGHLGDRRCDRHPRRPRARGPDDDGRGR